MKKNKLQRILVIGTSGCGKTTLAKFLSDTWSLPHIEMDLSYWSPDPSSKGKRMIPNEFFREGIAKAMSTDRWIACGNYHGVADITWNRAQLILWLDYPIWIVFWRLFKRILKRCLGQEKSELPVNESLFQHFFTKRSLFLWALQTHWKRRKMLTSLIEKNDKFNHITFVRIHSQKDLNEWLKQQCAL